MKILFGAHGSILKVFHDVDLYLRRSGLITDSMYWLSDSQYFQSNKNELELFSKNSVDFVKEWDFTNKKKMKILDAAVVSRLESQYGEPYLWNAIISDRRLMYGRLCKSAQDYRCQFTHAELSSIVFGTLFALEQAVEKFKPDCIVTFVPASYGDYLLYLIAQKMGIRFLHLKSTKIKNYFTLSESIYENPTHIYSRYKENLRIKNDYPFQQEAENFLQASSSEPLQYEGNIHKVKKSFLASTKKIISEFLGVVSRYTVRRDMVVIGDNHVPPLLGTFLENNFRKKRREKMSRKLMASRQFNLENSQTENFVFFPMHSEPEIAISVYGRNHQNQIETIRRMAQSIPLTWKLVIKEHPRTISYRSRSYYNKILEIPNVYFANPDQHPFYLINSARAVVTISGFVGLESLVLGKPLLILGEVPYDVFPDSMIRKVRDMEFFALELKDLIEKFKVDKDSLNAFVAACMSESVAINLYSDLLKKGNRISFENANSHDQIERLSKYLIQRIKQEFCP